MVNNIHYKLLKRFTASSLVLLAVSFYACESNKPEEIKAITGIEDNPSLIITKLETTINDSGMVKYRFLTPEMYQYDKKENPYVEFPQGLNVIMYDKRGQIDARIKSNYAKFLTKDKLWELKNDVEAVNQKGDVLNTEQLYWDQSKQLIYSNLFTKVTTQTEILTGIGFEANERFTSYTFRQPQGVFDIEEQP